MKIVKCGILAGVVMTVAAWLFWLRTDYTDARCLMLGAIAGVTAGICALLWIETKPQARSVLSGNGGFTLIELLAVIVIIALISAIGFPALKAMQGTALATGARQFSNALNLARQYAINSRKPVRVVLAVDSASMGAMSSNLICRAYSVYQASNDLNGVIVSWWPLQDWKVLPTGVVFSDHASLRYTLITNSPIVSAGLNIRTLGNAAPSWLHFDNTATMQIVTNNITASFVEFMPTGEARPLQTPPQGAAGVRLALGAVVNPATRGIIINDTNNWVYIEYDNQTGRVRVRHPESYQ